MLLDLGFNWGADVDIGDSAIHSPGLYTGPPPAPAPCSIPATPSASILAQQIIHSTDKLFFISWKIGFSVCEWQLIPVALSATTSSYLSCLKDGKYTVNFYTSHPSDSRMNAVSQRFWLRYHSREDLMGPCSSCDTHLIRPTDTSEAYAWCHHLFSFCQYVNLTHLDTYIHRPFNFATFGSCKSRDRVSGDDWSILDLALQCFTTRCHRWRLLLTQCTSTPALILHSTTVPFQGKCHHILSRRRILSSYILDKRSRISHRFSPIFSFLFTFFWGPFWV
jgi:hypothetical protein